ncbi:MAG: phosphotransferase [Planctomycetes bacterium]|nr:phosphotransferase [Planctomycetota bacterium]
MRRQEWLIGASVSWFREKLAMGWMSDDDWRCTPIKYVPESRLVCRLKGRWQFVAGGDKWVRAYVRISRLDGSAEQVEVLNAVKGALVRADMPFDVPSPLAAMPEHHLLATEFVRGTTLRQHVEAGHLSTVIEACRRIARLSQLDGIHILRPRPTLSPGPRLMLAELVAAAPSLAVHLHTLGDWAHTLPEPPAALLPVHGDLHAGQIIEKNEQFFLVDWDRAALGDPTCDICNLASEVEYRQQLMDVQGARLTAMDLIDAWRSVNGAFNSEAAPWWFAYACVLRAWGLLRHLRPNWSQGAEWLLQRAASVMRRRALVSGQ